MGEQIEMNDDDFDGDFWIFVVSLRVDNRLILKMVPHGSSLTMAERKFLKEEANNWHRSEREWNDMVSRMMSL